MKRSTRVISGTFAGVIQMLVAIALQIVLMPLILRTVGQDVLGVYAVILQIIGYLILLDLGISTALGRSLSQAIYNQARFRELMSSGFYLMCVVGFVYALVALVLAFMLRDLLHLSSELASQARIAMLCLGAWGLFRFPLSIFQTSLMAIQDLSIPPLLGAVTNTLRMVLSVASVLANLGLIGLIGATVIAEALLAVMMCLRFQRLRPGWIHLMGGLNATIRQELQAFGLKALWGNLAGRVILFTDNIVVGNLYGAASTSIYYSTQTPIAIAYSLVLQLAGNASPAINELWAHGEWAKLRDILLRLQRLTLLLVTPIAIGGWFYLATTITIWVGRAQFAGPWMTLWLILFAILLTTFNIPQYFVYASGHITRFSQLTLFEAALNLALSYALGSLLGLQGVALATTIAHIPTSAYLQRRAQHDLHISWHEWWQATIWPSLTTAIPTAIAAFVLSTLFPPLSWYALAVHGMLVMGVHALSLFVWGLNGAERALVVQRINALSNRWRMRST